MIERHPNMLTAEENDEISLKDLIDKVKELFFYLLKYWVLIVVAGFLGGLFGLYYAWDKKPVYEAKYTFVLEDEKPGGLSGALGLASQFGLDLGSSGGGVFSGDNLVELMRSRIMVQRALLSPVTVNGKTKSLAEYYIDINKMREGWAQKPALKNLSFPVNADISKFTRVQDSVLMNFHKGIIGGALFVDKVEKKLSILKVEVKSQDEFFAKYFCEALVEEVSRFYIDTKTLKSSSTVAVLQHQADSVRGELNSAITGVAQSSDNTLNLNPARQVLRTPSQRRQIDVQANTAILTELIKNLELSKFSLRKETPLIQAIDKPVFPLPMEKVSKLKSLIVGGILGGFLSVIYLIFRRVWGKAVE